MWTWAGFLWPVSIRAECWGRASEEKEGGRGVGRDSSKWSVSSRQAE